MCQPIVILFIKPQKEPKSLTTVRNLCGLKDFNMGIIINKFFEMLGERPQYKDIEYILHNARSTYNQILFVKNRKSAYYLMNLAIFDTQKRISEMLKDDESFRPHTLNYHSVYARKYLQAIDYYFHRNEHGNYVWYQPLAGDFMKFRCNYKDKNLAGKKCTLIKSVHHKPGGENLMECVVDIKNVHIVCEFGNLRQINKK